MIIGQLGELLTVAACAPLARTLFRSALAAAEVNIFVASFKKWKKTSADDSCLTSVPVIHFVPGTCTMAGVTTPTQHIFGSWNSVGGAYD